jgi:hypothetical protein
MKLELHLTKKQLRVWRKKVTSYVENIKACNEQLAALGIQISETEREKEPGTEVMYESVYMDFSTEIGDTKFQVLVYHTET